MPTAKTLIIESIHMECKEGTADKEYNAWISQDGTTYRVDASYGRRGSPTSTATKGEFTDLAKARRAYTSLVNSKLAKGYQTGSAGTVGHILTGGAPVTKAKRPVAIKLPQLSNALEESELESYMTNPTWYMQQKMDGERRIVEKKGFDIKTYNRKGQHVPHPAVFDDLQAVDGDFKIDCEIIGHELHLFDVLSRKGQNIAEKPFSERYVYLEEIIESHPTLNHVLHGVRAVRTESQKRTLFDIVKGDGGEGVVFKADVPYTPGRPASGGPSMKFKFWNTASFVVDKMNAQRSVGIMLFDEKGKEVSAGNVSIPVNHIIPPLNAIVEVRYLYAFKTSGIVFQPVYLGQRTDIIEKECTVKQLKYKPD